MINFPMINVRVLIELMRYYHDAGELVVGKDLAGRRTYYFVDHAHKYQMWYDVNGLTIRVTDRRIDKWDEFDQCGISIGDGSGYVFLPLEKKTVAKLKKLERTLYSSKMRRLLRV